MRTALLIVGGALLLGIGFGVGYLAGALLEVDRVYRRHSIAEERLLRPLLSHDPAYRSIELQWQSDGGVFLGGSVPTQADQDRLRAAVIRAIGEAWAKERMHVEATGRWGYGPI